MYYEINTTGFKQPFGRTDCTLGFQVNYAINDVIVRKEVNFFDVDKICRIIFDFFGIPFVKMSLATRKQVYIKPRQVCQWYFKEFTKLSLSYIGMRTGGKDHATVLHSWKTINNDILTNKKFALDIKRLLKIINDEL